MKSLYKLSVILVLLPLFSVAQSNYRPGYVVNLKGDTVKGFIDYQAWDSNPASINFKSVLTDHEKQTFNVHNARYFKITGLAAYIKYFVAISTDETNIDRIGESKDTSFRTDTVFLKVMQWGKNVALYRYADDRKVRFYIGEAPSYAPVELNYRLWRDASRAGGQTVYDNGYKKRLFALAQKYNALDDRLNAVFSDEYLSYRDDYLLKIVSRINNISTNEIIENYSPQSKLSVYLGTLVNISNTSSEANSSYSKGGGTPYTSYQPGLSVGGDFVPDKNGGRLEFRIDLSYAPAKMDAVYKLAVSPYGEGEASYNQNAVLLTPEILYNFYNAPNFRFFLGVGFNWTFLSFSNPYFGAHDRSDPNAAAFPSESYNFQTTNDAFMLKAGFRIHKNWEIHVDYITSQQSSFAGYFDFANQNTVVGVNYFFGQ